MLSQTVTVVNELGLHARAAAKIVSTAKQFDAKITLDRDDNRVDATSIIGILMLGGTRGTEVTIRAEGADAANALESVVRLFAERFGEPS